MHGPGELATRDGQSASDSVNGSPSQEGAPQDVLRETPPRLEPNEEETSEKRKKTRTRVKESKEKNGGATCPERSPGTVTLFWAKVESVTSMDDTEAQMPACG